MKTTIQKWGNSLGLRIPMSMARDMQIHEGSAVDVQLENGRLIVEPVAQQRLSLDELLDGITPSNLHKEVDFGKPVGREGW